MMVPVDHCSSVRPLTYGMPKGLMLSPMIFNICKKHLHDIIRKFGLQSHQYAYDMELYFLLASDPTGTVEILEEVI